MPEDVLFVYTKSKSGNLNRSRYFKNHNKPGTLIVSKQTSQAQLGAYDTQPSFGQNDTKNKFRFIMKEMDYKHLECMILTSHLDSHQDLVRLINKDWANPLGFSMKIKRPAKLNKDNSKTLRLYCSHHNNKYTQEDIEMIQNESGLNEESCFFGLTFRYIPQNQVWILYEVYDKEKMHHSHPFFYSFSDYQSSVRLSQQNQQSMQGTNNITDQQFMLDKDLQILTENQSSKDTNLVQKYFEIYKAILEKMSNMNQVLQCKASGLMLPTRKGTFQDGKLNSKIDPALRRKRRLKSQMNQQDNGTNERKTQELKYLFQKLIEMKTQDPYSIDYNSTRHEDCQSRIINLFYQTREMKQNYEIYQDFVFINRRLQKTRFKRNLILFQGMNFEGKTLIYGVALLKEDDIESYQFAVQSFFNTIGQRYPHSLIIERSSVVKNAIEHIIKDKPGIKLLYCYQHLYKSLKFQIRNMTYNKQLPESVKQVMYKVEKLPKIDNYQQVDLDLEECKNQSEQIKGECNEINIIVNKLYQEKKYWCKYLTIQQFTAGVNVYQRVEFMKLWLAKHLLKRDSNLDKSINLILDFSWIDRIHQAQIKQLQNQQKNIYNQLGNASDYEDKKTEIERITYEEYRITKSQVIDREPILNDYILKYLTLNAYERCKYNIGQGLKYWRIIKEDKNSYKRKSTLYIVQHVNPNQSKDIESSDKKTQKVKVFDEFTFCTCMEHFNTGLPCSHEFLVALKRHKKLLFSERWFKNYEEIAKKQNHLIQKVFRQNMHEQHYVYNQLIYQEEILHKESIDQIIEEDIRIDLRQKQIENFGEDTWLGKSWMQSEGMRIYQNDAKRACMTELNENDVENVEFLNEESNQVMKEQIQSFQRLMNIDQKKKRGRPIGGVQTCDKFQKPQSEQQSVQKTRNITSFFADTPQNAQIQKNNEDITPKSPIALNPKLLEMQKRIAQNQQMKNQQACQNTQVQQQNQNVSTPQIQTVQTQQLQVKNEKSTTPQNLLQQSLQQKSKQKLQPHTQQQQKPQQSFQPVEHQQKRQTFFDQSVESSHHKLTPSDVLRSSFNNHNNTFNMNNSSLHSNRAVENFSITKPRVQNPPLSNSLERLSQQKPLSKLNQSLQQINPINNLQQYQQHNQHFPNVNQQFNSQVQQQQWQQQQMNQGLNQQKSSFFAQNSQTYNQIQSQPQNSQKQQPDQNLLIDSVQIPKYQSRPYNNILQRKIAPNNTSISNQSFQNTQIRKTSLDSSQNQIFNNQFNSQVAERQGSQTTPQAKNQFSYTKPNQNRVNQGQGISFNGKKLQK